MAKSVHPSWPLHVPWAQQLITFWSGVPMTKFGTHTIWLCKLTSGWPLHSFRPHKSITLWSEIPTKFGSHMAFFSNLTSGWPLRDYWRRFRGSDRIWPPCAITAEIDLGWLKLAVSCVHAWLLTTATHYTLVQESSYQIWYSLGVFKQIELWFNWPPTWPLTPAMYYAQLRGSSDQICHTVFFK